MLSGEADVPYLDAILAEQEAAAEEQAADLEQRLALRGIANSTMGDTARGREETCQGALRAQTQMQGLQNVLMPMLARPESCAA